MREIYKERKQPKSRLKYGKLEKKRDLIKRLAKINEQNNAIQKANEEIRNKTGQEYFFGYYSVKKGDVCAYKINNPSIDELNKMRLYVDNEIHRVEKKMERYISRPINTHIKFESDTEIKEGLFDFTKSDKIRKEFGEYIEQLKIKRKEILGKINILKSDIIKQQC